MTALNFNMAGRRRPDRDREIDRLNEQITELVAERKLHLDMIERMGLAMLRADRVDQDD